MSCSSTSLEKSLYSDLNLIDQLLGEQQQLQTPVATFAKEHSSLPDQEQYYRTLIPSSQPQEGQQYAFEVELDKCTSCKACVTACHSLNGLDENETWRDVGTLLGGEEAPGWQQTITSACHHCIDPECLNGCPVAAYDKDPVTGIVRHLDDQCIGCQYCVLKCPYDVPKYNPAKGIVRKCDMCYSRLNEGEAPACVQACPNEAIKIVTIDVAEKTRQGFRKEGFLIGAPSPHLSLPSTIYKGRNLPKSAHSASQKDVHPEHGHWPLVAMLTLTQIGVGASLAIPFLQSSTFITSLISVVFVIAGLGLGVCHLGRPMGVWRFFLGLKTSWLSREFAIFGAYSGALTFLPIITFFFPDFSYLRLIQGGIAGLGLLAVFTSIMIYVDTNRPFWKFSYTATKFYGTSFAATFALLSLWSDSLLFPSLFTLVMITKLGLEIQGTRKSNSPEWSPAQHSAKVLLGPLRCLFRARIIMGIAALLLMGAIPLVAFSFLLLSELLERITFFKAVYHPRMPGIATHSHH